MAEQEGSILEQLTPLAPLDLGACKTVSDIAAGMARCSFGARMLGEVAETLTTWTMSEPKPVIIYDGKRGPASALHGLLDPLCRGKNRWFARLFTSEGFARSRLRAERALIVGPITERLEERTYGQIGRAIFINNIHQCRPGQIRDGYFPDVVFADPRLVMPILYFVIRERRGGAPCSITELMMELKRYGGGASELVNGAKTLKAMLDDRVCTVMLTISGAMTIAKMQLLAADLIETGRIAYVSTTGALMAHGLVEGSGCEHYKYDPRFTDEQLAAVQLNRVSDTVEPEGNFDHIEQIVEAVLSTYPNGAITSSHEFHAALGAYLAKHYPQKRAILKSAYERSVPIVTPAFTDSELANDVFVHNARRSRSGRHRILFDLERDTGLLFELATRAKRLGTFIIGGGVPRNNTQNVAPLMEIYRKRMDAALRPGIFQYGCRIDPASMTLGHLSGCTFREGGTWRKFDFSGTFAEVRVDATIAWPFIQKHAFERLYL